MATSLKNPAAGPDPSAPDRPRDAVVNAFAGGLLELVQRAQGGHRAGLESLLLAAAVDRSHAGTVIDLGAGVGAVGLTIAARCPEARIVLVDRDGRALACAGAALKRPANRTFADRVEVRQADVDGPDLRGLNRSVADLVVANPPFHVAADRGCSPDPARRAAHVLGKTGLQPWIESMEMLLKSGGAAILITASGRLDQVMRFMEHGFGGIDLLPVQGRPGRPASRVLVRAVKGSRAPVRLFPPLVLHGERGPAYLHQIEKVLRGRAGLSDVCPGWRRKGAITEDDP